MMKKFISMALSFLLIATPANLAFASDKEKAPLNISSKSAILMDVNSGQVLYQKNPHEKLPPASVTKVMTMLLICESLEKGKIKLEDEVQISEEASSMGGSQIFLEAGEKIGRAHV